MKIFKIMIFGGIGASLRFILSLIINGNFLSITVINLLGVFTMGLTENYSILDKEYYSTGLYGGFTSISAIMLLSLPLVAFVVNVLLGILIYYLAKKL